MARLPTIEVREHGRPTDPVVVVLHGGPGAPGSARGLARALAPRFRVLEPLQRRAGDVPLTVARHVEDLLHVAPAGAALVGWSWGAMLALSFAAAYPARARRLALVGCGTYSEVTRAEYRRRMARRGGAPWAELQEAIARSEDGDERERLLARLAELGERVQGHELLPTDGADGVEVDAAGHQETWADVLRLQTAGVEPLAFRTIRSPVLMLHGAHDPHPGRATYELLRGFVPQLELCELAACGHTPWRERHAREPFLERLTRWLETDA